MSDIYSWMKDIIIFLVLTTIIANLLGKSTYKKYINLITGIILVVLVVSPLFKLFKIDDTLEYYFTTNLFEAETESFNGRLIEMEETQKETIFWEYKNQIKTQVSGILEAQGIYVISIQISVIEDTKSESFGKINTIDIIASENKNEAKGYSSSPEKIVISKIKIGDKEEDEAEKEIDSLSPIEINVKNLLADFYNMKPDNINISIQVQ